MVNQSCNLVLAAMLSDSVATARAVVVVVMRMHPRAIPLAMITMRKSTDVFPFLSYVEYWAPLGGPLGCRSSATMLVLLRSKKCIKIILFQVYLVNGHYCFTVDKSKTIAPI